jgi:hypothetical protein
MTRYIAGCFRFFTLTRSGDGPPSGSISECPSPPLRPEGWGSLPVHRSG